MKTTTNKNKYFSFIQKQAYKLAIVSFLVLTFFSILNINQTFAYLGDTETSDGNIATVGTLSISLNDTTAFSSDLMYPTDSTSTPVSMDISNTGSLNSQYIAKTTLTGGDTSACDYITMTATSPTSTYIGLIKNFTSIATTTTDTTWDFDFSIDSGAPANVWGKTCYFKWNYTAWQTDLPDASTGFNNVKEKLGQINIGKAVVLNEILYNPDNITPAPAPADNEFIELYNNSNISIDLAGWQVSEMNGLLEQKYTITTIAGLNTAVPYSGSTIILSKGWMVLQLSNTIALDDAVDTVRLYDLGGINEIDAYTYIGGKAIGNSDARIPDGIGAWVDPIPTPGEPNKLTDEAIIPETKPEEDVIPEVLPNTTETTQDQLVVNDTTTGGPAPVDKNQGEPVTTTPTIPEATVPETTKPEEVTTVVVEETTTDITVTEEPVKDTNEGLITPETQPSPEVVVDQTEQVNNVDIVSINNNVIDESSEIGVEKPIKDTGEQPVIQEGTSQNQVSISNNVVENPTDNIVVGESVKDTGIKDIGEQSIISPLN